MADLHAIEYQEYDLAAGHLRTFAISLLSQGQPALTLTEELVTEVRAEVAEQGMHAAKVLATSEVQEPQVEDWQEKARTVGTVTEGLRSDLSLCRQQ